MNGKLMFIALCAVNNVGAAIGRPAVQCCEFAENQCEFVTFLCAGGGSPPLHSKSKQQAKLKFERTKQNAPLDKSGAYLFLLGFEV
ncbi:MAG: hypothetical protein IKT52_05950 [Oscillospiraceae bacterium]|nr:hypothetical protein [Oscillospiraceae bacterium]